MNATVTTYPHKIITTAMNYYPSSLRLTCTAAKSSSQIPSVMYSILSRLFFVRLIYNKNINDRIDLKGGNT